MESEFHGGFFPPDIVNYISDNNIWSEVHVKALNWL